MPFFLAAFTWARTTWIGKALALAGGVLIAVALVFAAGGRAARQKRKVKDLDEYIEFRHRADRTADRTLRELDGITDSELERRLRKHRAIRPD